MKDDKDRIAWTKDKFVNDADMTPSIRRMSSVRSVPIQTSTLINSDSVRIRSGAFAG